MKRMSKLKEDIIGYINDIVDRPYAAFFESLFHPVRRLSDSDALYQPACIAAAEIRGVYLNPDISLLKRAFDKELRFFKLQSEGSSYLSGDPKDVETIRPVRRDIDFHHYIAVDCLHALDLKSGHRKTVSNLFSRGRYINKILYPL